MTRVVVDTSIVFCVLASEPLREAVMSSLHDTSWVAAESLSFEIGNALSSRLKQKKITPQRARLVLEGFAAMDVDLILIDLAATVELCISHNLYAYDAYVLTTAQRYNLPLATLDRRMGLVARAIGLDCMEFKS